MLNLHDCAQSLCSKLLPTRRRRAQIVREKSKGRNFMKKKLLAFVCATVLGIVGAGSFSTSSYAGTGSVRIAFSSGGFIIGAGGGRGVLTFRGHHYPFTVSGMSFGLTIGLSTMDLVGRARNLHSPRDLVGTYSTI